MIELVLPFPPSVNHYLVKSVRYARGKGYVHVAVSKNGINYRGDVLERVFGNKVKGRVSVYIELCPPTAGKYDLDNFPKVLLDSLTHAKLWSDDECVDKLTIERGEIDRPNGHCVVKIYPYASPPKTELA